MYVCTIDGVATFAVCLITTEWPEIGDQTCWTEAEKTNLINYLIANEIPYTVQDFAWDIVLVNKTKGLDYQSKSELLEHLELNIEPKSAELPRLKREKEELEDVVLQLMFGEGQTLPEPMFSFLKRKYEEGKLTEQDLNKAIMKGWITMEEAEIIKGGDIVE